MFGAGGAALASEQAGQQHRDPRAILPVAFAEQSELIAFLQQMPTNIKAVARLAKSRCPAVMTGAAHNATMRPR